MVTDCEFLTIAKSSYSIADLLKRLGLTETNRSRRRIKERLSSLEFTEFAVRPLKLPNLGKNSGSNSSNLKKRLIAAGILSNRCAGCGQGPYWNNKPLTLQLEHKDGDHRNNEITNLEILCPNCHSQTSTYSKPKTIIPQKPRYRASELGITYTKLKNTKRWCKCGANIEYRNISGLCSNCRQQSKKITRPSYEELLHRIQEIGRKPLARVLGVSSTVVKRWVDYGKEKYDRLNIQAEW